MFENAFKYVDDVLHKDPGCSTELDYVEQSSWLLFLKYLDDYEKDREAEATLKGHEYKPIIKKEFRWSTWAAPRGREGKIDLNKALTGDDLLEFVNGKLWKYLKSFKQSAESSDTIQYKIGEIFDEVENKIRSGYNLREVIDRFDELRFGSAIEKHEMSALYEQKIQRMGNAGRNGGEYYTPRPLIRAIIKVVDPKLGETVYDPAVGSAGFLCEAYEHMRNTPGISTAQLKKLQTKSLYGKEKKSLAYIIGIMNMILHGIEAPNIIHTNTLSENVMDIQEKDRYDVVLANPPFGGKERAEVQHNFPIRSGETAYLFLQHFIRSLKAGGRAGIVIKNTFLSNGDGAALRKELLATCDLHTVLDLPAGTFAGAGVNTVVLFFVKGRPSRSIWYYELDPGRKLGKTAPLNDADLEEFVSLSRHRKDSARSWTIDVSKGEATSLDLSVRNPNAAVTRDARTPQVILNEIQRLERDASRISSDLARLL